MDTSVYFENISKEIAKRLDDATYEIVIAIAWFTDANLFNILRRKASHGIHVKLLYLDDKINKGASFNVRQLEAFKANVFPISPEMQSTNIMHNKFCVIDGRHIVTGSYNWTNRAKSNDENITVFLDNPEIGVHFLKAFDGLLEKYNYQKSVNVSPNAVIPRLEVIKNFVLLDEWDEARKQLEKLRSFEELWDLSRLFVSVDQKLSDEATAWIAAFVRDKMSLVVHEDEDIKELKIELRILEFKVVALSAEKDGLEKKIFEFQQKTNLILGELTAEYLRIKSEKKQKEADRVQAQPDKKEKLQSEAKQARAEYERYHEDFAEQKRKPTPLELSDDDKKELKKVFKNATQYCHPDKVSDEQKELANERFIKLKMAYDTNDLVAVRGIYEDLVKNRPYTENSEQLSTGALLKYEINKLETTSNKLLDEIESLNASIVALGIGAISDWDEYFESQRKSLVTAIEELKMELLNAE
ncbi:phospholipase D-like domain-containing protein [Rhodospirillales bacterium]|nr:phospholipase D-like domain-containing protein [Rhodospirillales bacterium]